MARVLSNAPPRIDETMIWSRASPTGMFVVGPEGFVAVTDKMLPGDAIGVFGPPLSGTSQSWPPELPSRTITLFASYQLSDSGSVMPDPMVTVGPRDGPLLRLMATSCSWLPLIMTARTPSGATWNEVTVSAGWETGMGESVPGGSSQTLPPAVIQRSPCSSQLSEVQGPEDEVHSRTGAALRVRSHAYTALPVVEI